MKVRSRLKGLAVFAVVVACATLGPRSASAQARTAEIVGVVTDSTGAVVPGARVTIRNLGTNDERATVTQDVGSYQFTLLPPGRYTIKAELPGFKTWTVEEITLAAADKVTLDAKLVVGATEESVIVIGESPIIQRQSTTLASLVDERAVQDLPLNGRNFITLAQLSAGAADSTVGFSTGSTPDDRRLTSQVQVNGQYAWANNFMIDGMDNNERFIGTVIVKPSVEAVQEMRIQTNLYSSEVGRTAGGVINLVTKSGMNQYRGSLYDFIRNDALDARDYFATSKLPYRQAQAGGSLGGPIRRDSMFFFGDYEGLRITQGQAFVVTVPTAAMRAGNFAGIARVFDPLTTSCVGSACTRTEFANDQIPANRLDPTAVATLALYPMPNRTGLANNYVSSGNRTLNQDTADGRVDRRISDKTSAFVRYSFTKNYVYLPSAFDAAPFSTSDQRTHGLQANVNRVLSSRTVAELRGGWSRYDIASLPGKYGQNLSEQLGIMNSNVTTDGDLKLRSSGLASIQPNGFQALGEGGFVPEFDKNDVYQVGASIAHLRGNHSFKFGGEFRKRNIAMSQSASPRGQFTFNAALTQDNPLAPGSGTGHTIASMLLGYPNVVSRTIQVVNPVYLFTEVGAFAQDDWRIRQNLTINAGVRYDYYSPATEQHDYLSNFDLTAKKIIVAGQNGVGATAGVERDPVNLAPRLGLAWTVTEKTVLRGGYGVSFVPPFMGTPGAYRNPPFVSLYGSVAAVTTPTAGFATGLPHVVPSDPSNPIGTINAVGMSNFEVPYVHQFNLNFQRELPLGMVAAASYVGQRGEKQFFPNQSPDLNAPAPGNPATVAARRPFVATQPNMTNLYVYGNWAKTRYNAMQLTLERRFAGGWGSTVNYTLSHAEDQFDYHPVTSGLGDFLWGDSNLDIRHRITATANYQLPFARSATGVAGALAKGWQVNIIAQGQSGLPFSVTNSTDVAGTGAPNTTPDRTNLVPGADPTLPASERTPGRYFNTSAFVRQPVGTYGTFPRNGMRGPSLVKFDLSVSKSFQITSRTQFQFTAQAFNIFNRINFNNPSGLLGTGAFGTITSAQPPRQMQLSLKLIY
jgi:outer membrane receptor protein involved in Fe transport